MAKVLVGALLALLPTLASAQAVTDDDGVLFKSAFDRLGGAGVVGPPITGRFEWDGFTVQAFQRVVFQWRPECRCVMFVNVFERLHELGHDDFLLERRQWSAVELVERTGLDGLAAWGAPAPGVGADLDGDPRRGVTTAPDADGLWAAWSQVASQLNAHPAAPSPACLALDSRR